MASKGGLSQARTRLGAAPLEALFQAVVRPLAVPATKGAWYRHWRVVAVDGSTLEVADTAVNGTHFGGPRSGAEQGAYPQLRWVALAECGTRVLFCAALDTDATGEATLARGLFPPLTPEMLCLADRYYWGYEAWQAAQQNGAALLWRVKRSIRLDGVTPTEPSYRVVTNVLDPKKAPAEELAALYAERWEAETAFDELKTHLRGARLVLRSKTPGLVEQEFWGLLLAHYAVRGMLHEAALPAAEDPDRLSFVHAVRVIRRTLPQSAAFPPSAVAGVVCGHDRGNLRGARRQQPGQAPSARREAAHPEQVPDPQKRHQGDSRGHPHPAP